MRHRNAEDLDRELIRVQQSTRTLFPGLSRLHNWLRMRSRFYYRWHLNPRAKFIHFATLLLITALNVFNIAGLVITYPATTKAATSTWTTTSDFSAWSRTNTNATNNSLTLSGDWGTVSSSGTFPSARFGTASFWDDTNGKMYVIGGTSRASAVVNEITEYNPTTGGSRVVNTLPAVLNVPAVAWDSTNRIAYIFGGSGTSNIYAYDVAANTVTLKTTFTTGRQGAGAAWDSVNNKAYMFGGLGGSSYLNSIVMYDPSTNTATTQSTTLPVGIANLAAVFNPSTGTFYTLGGQTSISSYYGNILEYDPSAGTVTTAGTMTAATNISAVRNPNTGAVYIFGGYNGVSLNNIQVFTPGSGTTSTHTLSTARSNTSAVWDSTANTAYIYAGREVVSSIFYDEVLTYDGTANATVKSYLPNHTNHSASVWNSNDSRLYIIGGRNASGGLSNQVITYDPATQTAIVKTTLSSTREKASAIYDTTNGKIYIFGGNTGSTSTQIVEYDPVGNTSSVVANFSSAREGVSAVWDSNAGLVYLFGGKGASYLTDILAFDPQTATLTSRASFSTARAYTSAVWDSSNSVAYVFGGYRLSGSDVYLDEVIQFQPSDNSISNVGTLPSARAYTSAIWDSGHGVANVFGGQTSSTTFTNQVLQFDSVNGVTTKSATLTAAKYGTSAAWDGTKAYVAHGLTTGSVLTNTILTYDPSNTTYQSSGSATRIFTPQVGTPNTWNSATISTTTNSQTASVEYTTNTDCATGLTATISSLSSSESICIKILLSTSDTSITPVINDITVDYTPVSATPSTSPSLATSPSPSPSPSISPSPSPSPSVSPEPSPSPSPSPSASPSPEVSVSPSPEVSTTPTPSPTSSATVSPSPSPITKTSPTPSVTPSDLRLPTPSPTTSSSAPSPSPTVIGGGIITPSPTPPTNQGYTLKLTTDKSIYTSGEAITGLITLTNLSTNGLALHFSTTKQADYVIQSLDNPAIRYQWSSGRSFSDSASDITVNTNAEYGWNFIHTSSRYVLPAGRYQVTGIVTNYGTATTTISIQEAAITQPTAPCLIFCSSNLAVVIDPRGGTFDQSISARLSLLPAGSNADIHFTLDGSEPTIYSPLYRNPVYIDRSLTLKAKAFSLNGSSQTASADFTILGAAVSTSDLSVQASPQGGSYEKPVVVSLTPSRTATIYYTSDGSDPRLKTHKYVGPLSLTQSAVLRFFAEDANGQQSLVMTEQYTIKTFTTVALTWEPVATHPINGNTTVPASYQVLCNGAVIATVTETHFIDTTNQAEACHYTVIGMSNNGEALGKVKGVILTTKPDLGDLLPRLAGSTDASSVLATTVALTALVSLLALPLITTLRQIWPAIISLFLLLLGKKHRLPWGHVYDDRKKPLADVLVTLARFDDPHRIIQRALTDKKGAFGFQVKPDRYFLAFAKTGYFFPSTRHPHAYRNGLIDTRHHKPKNLVVYGDIVTAESYTPIIPRSVEQLYLLVLALGSFASLIAFLHAMTATTILITLTFSLLWVIRLTKNRHHKQTANEVISY